MSQARLMLARARVWRVSGLAPRSRLRADRQGRTHVSLGRFERAGRPAGYGITVVRDAEPAVMQRA
jgi:hypothetical protein